MDEMKHYQIHITRQAEEQMREIARYIAVELQNPDAAEGLLDALGESMQSLCVFPAKLPLVLEEPWRSEGIHRMSVKNFLFYFWIDEENERVQITGVVYEKRNQKKFLKKMQID